MECQKCGTMARVYDSGYTVVNDDTPDIPTELYFNQVFVCTNAKCDNNGNIVDTVRHPIELGGEGNGKEN